MALPLYIGAGAAATGGGALTPGLPVGVMAADILLLIVNNTKLQGSVAATLSSDEGFVQVTAGNSGALFGGWSSEATLFWKRATGADVAPTVAANGNFSVARIYLFRGCTPTGQPWDAVSTDGDADENSTMTMEAGATTVGANRLVCVFVTGVVIDAGLTLTGWTNPDLTNLVVRDTTTYLIGGGDYSHLALTTGERAAPGAYGPTTATWSGGSYWGSTGITLALKGPDTEGAPASLGGIMTILLLAQRGTRHERQLVYGKKHPMRRK